LSSIEHPYFAVRLNGGTLVVARCRIRRAAEKNIKTSRAIGSPQAHSVAPGLSVLALAIGALGLPVASAQQVPASLRGAPSRRRLQKVIVSAAHERSRRTEQSVPASTTVLSAAQLRQTPMDSLSDLAARVPGLEVNGMLGEGTPLYALRGISALDDGRTQAGPVATYVDGVYEGNVVLMGVDLFDLQEIEVRRGPQGVTDPMSAPAGAIDFITRPPAFDAEGYLTLGTGDYGRREAAGALQDALSDRLAVRVAFTYTKVDGFVRNVLPGYPDLEGVDQYGVRLSTLYRVSDDLHLSLHYSRSLQDPQNYAVIDGCVTPPIPASCAPGGVGFTGYYRTTTGTLAGVPLAADQIAQNYTLPRRQADQDVSLTTGWEPSSALALTSITSWSEGSLFNPEGTDGAPVDVLKTLSYEYVGQSAEDLRLSVSASSRLTLLVGGRYQHQDLFDTLGVQLLEDPAFAFYHDWRDCAASSFGPGVGYSAGSLLNPGCGYASGFDERQDSSAAYSNADFRLSRRVTVHAGLRFDHDEAVQSRASAQLLGSDGVPIASIVPGTPVNGTPVPLEALPGSTDYAQIIGATTGQTLADSIGTFRAAIDFRPVRDALLYLSYNTAYRPGAFNPVFYASAEDLTRVEPEKLGTVEAGVKTSWLDERLLMDAAVYHSQYEDQQSLDTLPTGQQMLINLPRSKIDGGELDIAVRPAHTLLFDAGVALLDTDIQAARIDGGLVNVSGNRLPFAPSASGTLSADWNAISWRSAALTLHADGRYVSKEYFDLADDESIAEGGYGALNARATLRASRDRWSVSGWCRNLTDKLYWTDAVNLQALGFDYRHRSVPRMYGIDLTLRL
jgi:iron complex outermembrane recepter protein